MDKIPENRICILGPQHTHHGPGNRVRDLGRRDQGPGDGPRRAGAFVTLGVRGRGKGAVAGPPERGSWKGYIDIPMNLRIFNDSSILRYLFLSFKSSQCDKPLEYMGSK